MPTPSLDVLNARIAAMRKEVESPSFRAPSKKERVNSYRTEIASLVSGKPLVAPNLGPPSKRAIAAKARLLAQITKAQAELARLRQNSPDTKQTNIPIPCPPNHIHSATTPSKSCA